MFLLMAETWGLFGVAHTCPEVTLYKYLLDEWKDDSSSHIPAPRYKRLAELMLSRALAFRQS